MTALFHAAVTRRRFLRTSAAALAASALPSVAPAQGARFRRFEIPDPGMPPRMLDSAMLPTPAELDASEATRQRIDEAVRDIVMGAFERAVGILADNRAVLERTAQALLKRETLDEAALDELTRDLRRSADDAPAPAAPAPAWDNAQVK